MDNNTKSSKEIKRDKVSSLAEKIQKAKSITFANYHGLGANEIAILRSKIKEVGGEFAVEKNTLVAKSLDQNKLKITKDQIAGPTAIVLAYEDEIAPIKELAASNKEFGFPNFKFGFLEKEFLESSQLEELAKLPNKDQLRAKVVGSISSPIYGFVNALSANLRNLVYVLDQVSKRA